MLLRVFLGSACRPSANYTDTCIILFSLAKSLVKFLQMYLIITLCVNNKMQCFNH